MDAKPIKLTEHGKQLVSHSANFRNTKQLYMLEPVNANGNVKVGTDEKGSVFAFFPEADVVMRQ